LQSFFWPSLGGLAIRDIAKGEAQTLSRMSTRVYRRTEEPLNFWMTVAAELIWLVFGLFLLTLAVGGMLGFW